MSKISQNFSQKGFTIYYNIFIFIAWHNKKDNKSTVSTLQKEFPRTLIPESGLRFERSALDGSLLLLDENVETSRSLPLGDLK